jgi:hypothetical protein
MPLDALMELWAAYGRSAENVPALKATSAAFAALAAEREALRTASELAERGRGELERGAAPLRQRPDRYPYHALARQPLVEALTCAMQHWYEAALFLADARQMAETGPNDLDYATLIGYTFQQRARVGAIVQALLGEQVAPYQTLLVETFPRPASDQHLTSHQQTGGAA